MDETLTETGSGGKEFYSFFKSISPKVNVVARLEIELTYNDVSVHCVNYTSLGLPPLILSVRFRH